MRTIIQIATVPAGAGAAFPQVVALCADGTLWVKQVGADSPWTEIKEQIPPSFKPTPEGNDVPVKGGSMALEDIKSTASKAVSDAVEQAYAQGRADQLAEAPQAGSGSEAPSEPSTPPVNVDALVAAAFNEGVLAENKRMVALVDESIASERSTEDMLREKMQIKPVVTEPSSEG